MNLGANINVFFTFILKELHVPACSYNFDNFIVLASSLIFALLSCTFEE